MFSNHRAPDQSNTPKRKKFNYGITTSGKSQMSDGLVSVQQPRRLKGLDKPRHLILNMDFPKVIEAEDPDDLLNKQQSRSQSGLPVFKEKEVIDEIGEVKTLDHLHDKDSVYARMGLDLSSSDESGEGDCGSETQHQPRSVSQSRRNHSENPEMKEAFITKSEFLAFVRSNTIFQSNVMEKLDRLLERNRDDSQSILQHSSPIESPNSTYRSTKKMIVAEVFHDNKNEVLEVPADIFMMVSGARKARGLFKILLRHLHPGCNFENVTVTGSSKKNKPSSDQNNPSTPDKTTSLNPLSRKFCIAAAIRFLPVDRLKYTSEEFYNDAVSEYEKSLHKNLQHAIADLRVTLTGKRKVSDVENEEL